ncbi:hypothetical protein E2C01_039709 [Portunus trituberculatus]|uniref:Uncharacterized protein n=1 Tax=Portunus trituberculatus TaxID=210409 RepID=A0A5B7FHQ6_PORTR|nr:hypothetical protein [Portunus trituberculatus]
MEVSIHQAVSITSTRKCWPGSNTSGSTTSDISGQELRRKNPRH